MKIALLACALALTTAGAPPVEPDDVTAWCKPADANQHRLCQMKEAGSFLGVPVELRFIEFDLLTNRRAVVIYAFALNTKPALERAIRSYLPNAEERLDPWGHAEGTHVWKASDRTYTLEPDNGKMTVRVELR